MVCIYINGENEIQHVHSESLMLELCDKGLILIKMIY